MLYRRDDGVIVHKDTFKPVGFIAQPKKGVWAIYPDDGPLLNPTFTSTPMLTDALEALWAIIAREYV